MSTDPHAPGGPTDDGTARPSPAGVPDRRTNAGADSGASVIVRALDEVDTIERTFRALRSQTCPVEIVVVDSGSTDGTLALARAWADVLIQMSPEDFTYGGALNAGAAAASGRIHFALSAHCTPSSATWIEDCLALHADERVAATCGALRTPRGEILRGEYVPSLEDILRQPSWGFSNHASSWRADVWRAKPFREDLRACEDKEWSWRVLSAGHRIVFSPRIFVSSAHRRSSGLRQLRRRVAREAEAMVLMGATRPPTLEDVIRAWWSSFSADSDRPRALRRLSPHRAVELAGAWAGGRKGASGRQPHASRRQGRGLTDGNPPPYLPWAAPHSRW